MTDRLLPSELAGEYETVKILKELPERQTLLLRRRDGALAILKRSTGDGGFDERVYDAVKSLDGDGAPRLLALFESGGAHCLLREYVEGETLWELCRRRGPLKAGETASIGIQLCDILERLHGLPSPIIHRDIKAENVVVSPDGRCTVIDFGIARIFDLNDTRDTRIMGTGFAAAPEQFGYAQTDPRSDIYSLGVLLHELASGECTLGKGRVPARLRGIVAKCTRFDPADRYQSAAELKKALKRVKRGHWPIFAAVTAAAAVLTAALIPGAEPERVDVYRFASELIGREVSRQLGKDVGEVTYKDLERITSIKLIGTVSFDDWEMILIHGEDISLSDKVEEGMFRGTVDTLMDIPNMRNLTELALCNQEISDLEPLSGTKIVRLALHGNDISDLGPLGECESLQELIISGNPVKDLSALSKIPDLWKLNIGGTEVTGFEELGRLKVLSYLDIIDCPGIRSLEGVEKIEGLKNLFVRPVSLEDLARINGITGLEGLGIWSGEPIEDLTGISALTELKYLYADITDLTSVKGIEGMKKLAWLDVRSGSLLNAAPVAELTALERANFAFMYSNSGWSEVSGLTRLKSATIRPGDEEAFRAALGGRETEIKLSPN